MLLCCQDSHSKDRYSNYRHYRSKLPVLLDAVYKHLVNMSSYRHHTSNSLSMPVGLLVVGESRYSLRMSRILYRYRMDIHPFRLLALSLDVVYIQRMDQAHIANSHHSSNDRFFRMYIVDGQTLYGPPVRPYLIKVLGLIRSAQLLLFGSNGFRLPDAHST